MKKPSRASSKTGLIVCPVCEIRELQVREPASARCAFCVCAVSGDMLEMLLQIVALPDALGKHACECGHPEMRLLPDDIYWCPACGSEVLPISPNRPRKVRENQNRT